MMFRKLFNHEIEVRPQQVLTYGNKVNASFLLYTNARTIVKILNETFNLQWRKEHYFLNDVNGNSYLVCRIHVYDKELKEWVFREDVGTESNTEKEKGLFSDSFKRSAVMYGIGAELYTAPNINIALKETEYYTKNGKTYLKSNVQFKVKEVEYDLNGDIVKLIITDNENEVRFSYDVEKESLLKELLEYSESLGVPVIKLEKSVFNKYKKALKDLTKEEITEIIHIYNEKEK